MCSKGQNEMATNKEVLKEELVRKEINQNNNLF